MSIILFIMATGIIGGIATLVFFIIVIAACCGSDSGNSSTPKRNTTTRPQQQRQVYRERSPSYCECPSCGSPYYDGYCEECGYPDINQGWLGENY